MYWVTSLSYTLAQTLVLNRLDKNALAKRLAANA
jgi:membrane protein insertase Oxa1/YidC/SpoIIIJ